jgi:FkbM family methyltransferase
MQLLKNIIKKCLSITPYEVVARNKLRPIPPATFDNIQLALAYYLAATEEVTFIQIGACDGVTGDSVHSFVRKGKMRAVLVEPIEQSFRKLAEAYAGVPNVAIVNSALSHNDGQVTLFKVKSENVKSVSLDWAPQLASFDKAHLIRHGILDDEIEEVLVPALTLKSLLSKYEINSVNILQIDTEGFDGEVVKMALDLPCKPECINFENLHLTADDLGDVFGRLEAHGYVWTHDRWNTLAVSQAAIQTW